MKDKFYRKTALREIVSLFPSQIDVCAVKSKPRIMPGLSFARIGTQEIYPNLVSEAKAMRLQFEAKNQNATQLSIGQYDFYIADAGVVGRALERVTLNRHVELILNSFLLESLVYENYIMDSVDSRIADLRFDQFQTNNLDYDVLINTIAEQLRIDAEVFRLSYTEKISSLSLVSKFSTSEVQKLSGRIRHALDSGKVIEIDSLQIDLDSFREFPELRIYIFPISSSLHSIPGKSDFMIVKSVDCDALSKVGIKSIDRCVDNFLDAKTRIGQQECLFWQTEQLTRLVELHDVDGIDHDDEFRKYMEKLGRFVLRSTQAHSFSYLQYNAHLKALDRAVYLIEANHDSSNVESMTIQLDPVLIKNTNENLSAYIFQNWTNHKERFVYVPNIRNKRAWGIETLTKISCERNRMIERGLIEGSKTASEIALVVQDQEMPIGVVCAESPYLDGMKSDLLFLRQIINNAAVFWSFLFRVNDQMWLRRNLQLQDISHNLSKLALGLEDGEAKSELSEISLRLEQGVTYQSDEDSSFEDRFNQMLWREAGNSSFLADELFELVKFFNPPRHKVPIMIQSAAIQIVRDLLRNRRHAANPNEITLTTRDAHGGASNILVIRTTLEMGLSDEELRDAFRRPIRRTDRDHVGLYMMGVVARTWGGRLDFDRSPETRKRKLEICLPFGKIGGNEIASNKSIGL